MSSNEIRREDVEQHRQGQAMGGGIG
ncbi:uncharacterized protein G2W53_009444 [Senna tora]|uniref:Uncharacterized protein n=1 Tax=Senna tora TaxID=362788 RepID=A0A835C9Y7_9FABA|nr:uncharacterized protein G2W53_009444 [Senna tora]